MKYNEEEIIKNLKNLKIRPDYSWQSDTLDRITGSKNNLFINFYLMVSKRKVALLAGSSILSAFLLLIVGVMLVNQLTLNTQGLSAAEKRRIFEQIINKNSSDVLTMSRTGANDSVNREAGSLAMDLAIGAPLIAPEMRRDYTYRYMKTTYEKGNAFGRCENMKYGEFLYTSESYEFVGENGESYYKYVETDDNGGLNSYSLSRYGTTSSEYIEYKGGNYAVRSKYEYEMTGRTTDTGVNVSTPEPTVPEDEVVSGPIEETPPVEEVIDYDALIEQYFGTDVDIVNVVNENGRTYYVVQYSYNTDCSGAGFRTLELYPTSENLPDTIYVQNYVDSESFEVVKTFNYLSNIDNSSLINITSIEMQSENYDFSQIANNFDFEYSVEIRDISYPEYNAEIEANKLSDYLADKNLILPILRNYTLQSAYSNEQSVKDYAIFNYYGDRDFYPAGTKGDQMYSDVIDSYGINEDMSVLSLSFSSTDQYVSMEVFPGSATLSRYEGSTAQSENITLDIGGERVAAQLNTYTSEIVPYTMRDDSVSSSDIPEREIRSFIVRELVFDFSGFKYRLSLPETLDVNTLSFDTINTSNVSQMNTLRAMIREIFVNPKSVSVDGSGASSIESVEPKRY